LPSGSHLQRQALRVAAAPRVDVDTAAPRVTRIHGELGGFATRPDVHEDALHAMLVKLIVVAKTHDVLKQAGLVNLCAAVTDADTAPVGLACDQAIAFQQIAEQCLCDRRFSEMQH